MAELLKPFNYAHVALVEGDQGMGKSVTMCAKVVDPTFANVTSIVLPDGREVKAEPVNPTTVGVVRFYLPGREPFVAKVPKHCCVIADSIKIYANFHFYGIRAKFMQLADMLDGLNSGQIRDCYLLCDEHYIGGDARKGMTALVETFTIMGFEMRKRRIELIMGTPYKRLIDYRWRSIVTEHVMCSYNERTMEVTLTVRKKGDRKYRTLRPFYAPQYWGYYDTNELVPLSDSQMAKAMAGAL